MDKLRMQTLDGVQGNIDKIAALFPNCITERKDAEGKVSLAIDFDKLRQELSLEIVEGREERYQFTWPDKKKAILLANSPINATLRPCREESVDFDNTQNLYIEGDNLDVLKCLKETYLGKVKMIYIDPPYNTGNDFVYEDDFAESTSEYLANSGQYDEQGNRLVTNSESNGRFHTDWLNMMYPRLKVARDLLTEDGVIFISIDENEINNLKKVCDEIFGEHNYITNFIWQSTPGSNTGTEIKTVTEDVLCYSRTRTSFIPCTRDIENTEKYILEDEYVNRRGKYILNKMDRRMTGSHYSDALNYPISLEDGNILYPGGLSTKQEHWNWRWSQMKLQWGIQNGFIVFKKDGSNWSCYFKQYLRVDNNDNPIMRTLPFQNLLNYLDGANSAKGTREVMDLLDQKLFDYPKPLSLLYELLKIVFDRNLAKDKEQIFLDFFSGSATSAHSIMKYNSEDGGNRKFIMVQLPELTDEKSEAYKAGYKTICEIGKERIRRAGKKIKEELAAKRQESGFFTEQEEEHPLDIGFRVLKLDSSNMEDVYYSPAEYNQQTLFAKTENVKSDRTSEDLLFQVMLELGATLDSKIEQIEIEGKTIYNVATNYLVVCFDNEIDDSVVTAIAKMQPQYAVFRDSSMADDSTATNFEQIFKTYSPNTVTKVL